MADNDKGAPHYKPPPRRIRRAPRRTVASRPAHTRNDILLSADTGEYAITGYASKISIERVTSDNSEILRRLEELEAAFNQVRPLAHALDSHREHRAHNRPPVLLADHPALTEADVDEGILAIQAIRADVSLTTLRNFWAWDLATRVLRRVARNVWLACKWAARWAGKRVDKAIDAAIAALVVKSLAPNEWAHLAVTVETAAKTLMQSLGHPY